MGPWREKETQHRPVTGEIRPSNEIKDSYWINYEQADRARVALNSLQNVSSKVTKWVIETGSSLFN